MGQPLGSRYLLHEVLGRGSMGQVFRGSVRSNSFPVAVKVLKPELISDPEVIARFVQERSILTSVSHPNVVRVVDLVVEGETVGIVMELVQGYDLRHLLSQRRTLPAGDAVYFVRQMLQGLAAVHAAGIIHRDIKPENVLVDTSTGQLNVKLTDFGIARLSYGTQLTRQPSLLGTPEYMAPEVADIAPATPAADLYSIGIVLYEMLAGRTPFAGGHPMAVLRRQMDQPPMPIPGSRTDLWALVEWLLAKDPRDRPSSAAEAATALGRVEPGLAGEPPLPPMPPLPELPAPSPVRSSMSPVRAGTSSGPAASLGYPPSGQAASLDSPAGQSGSLDHPATVLSYADSQRLVDEHAPTGDWSEHVDWTQRYDPPGPPGAGGPDGPGAYPDDETPPSPQNLRLVLGSVAAAVLVVAAAVILLLPRSSPKPAAAATPVTPTTVSYSFAPQEYPNGLLVVRRWTLAGKNGSKLTETVSASSATGRAMRVPFQDGIPESVARTIQTVVFTPAPTRIVQADPVVEWLLQLPSQGTVQVGYSATVPARGVSKARLMSLVKDFTALQASAPDMPRARTIQLASLTIEPAPVQLRQGQTVQLRLTGQLSDGQPAPAAILLGASWATLNPSVAEISSTGLTVGLNVGSTDVAAQLGTAQAAAPVTVTPGSLPTTGVTVPTKLPTQIPATIRSTPAKTPPTTPAPTSPVPSTTAPTSPAPSTTPPASTPPTTTSPPAG